MGARRGRAGANLGYVYYEEQPGRRAAAKLMTRDEARRIDRPPSVAGTTLPRQTLSARAVSVNCARTDLRGGRSAMSVPTATEIRN
jgi:hypothetical protein